MRPPWLTPRRIFLPLMLILVATLIWRNARTQKDASSDQVTRWLLDAVLRAEDDRDAPIMIGSTDPIIAHSFATWVRQALPANIAAQAAVTITPLGQSFFGSQDGAATHRAALQLRGSRAEADVAWRESLGGSVSAAIIGFRTLPATAEDASKSPALP